ncbi:MAG: hypothetical protein KDA91_13050 [Planctomycetaceae bacterium]|nr:hypothetical protein [Planctomycetaceae bacterium]
MLRFITLQVAILLSAISQGTVADEFAESGFGALEQHDHQPILVPSRPVIERIPISVIRPVDIKVAPDGAIYVADSDSESVFRMLPDRTVELAATGLSGLCRLSIDDAGTTLALTATAQPSSATQDSRDRQATADTRGTIVQLTRSGVFVTLHSIPFRPVGFCRSTTGKIAVVGGASCRLGIFDSLGDFRELPGLPEPAMDVALNGADQFYVLLQSGRVVRIASNDVLQTVGFAPAASSRLYRMPEGRIAVLSFDQSRDVIREITMHADESGPVLAAIPEGTSAVAFDRLGNMSLCNPNLRAVTRVTSTFMVDCPHCEKPIKMILSPNRLHEPQKSRSF